MLIIILSKNIDQKSLETEFSIAICRLIGDKWQTKTLFQAIFDLRPSIVKSIFDCHLPGVRLVRSDMGFDSTKPVFWVSDKAKLKSVSSATETS